MDKKLVYVSKKNSVVKNFEYNIWNNAVMSVVLDEVVFFFNSAVDDFEKHANYLAGQSIFLRRIIFRYFFNVNMYIDIHNGWDYRDYVKDLLKFYSILGFRWSFFFQNIGKFCNFFLLERKVSLGTYEKFKFGVNDFIPVYFNIFLVKCFQYLICPKVFSLFCFFCNIGFSKFLYFLINRFFYFFFNVDFKSSSEKGEEAKKSLY